MGSAGGRPPIYRGGRPPSAGKEALAVHYHAHVDIIVNGVAQTVPAGVGFAIQNSQETGITVLHTHDTSGVIHIESPTSIPYTLGESSPSGEFVSAPPSSEGSPTLGATLCAFMSMDTSSW